MLHVLYRRNGGEVEGVSTDASAYANLDAYHAVVTDPVLLNGADLRVPKIVMAGIMRNATAGEQAAFLAAKQQDDIAEDRVTQKDFADKRAYRALALVFLDWINANVPAAQRKTVASLRAEINARIEAL